MDIELVPITRLTVEPHRFSRTSITSNIFDHRKDSYSIEIRRKPLKTNHSFKARGWVYEHLQSNKFHAVTFILFIILVIIAGTLTICLTVSKAKNNCQYNFTRMMKSQLVTSSQPRSVALDDLNNDQQIDIVVANSGFDTIGIFLSNDNGTFTDQQMYLTGQGSRPYSVVINDFNNDTYLDIAIANYATNNIGIFLNKGNGIFNEQNIFSLGSAHPVFISIGDFNEDKRMDIAVVNYGTNNIGILLGYGNGSFQTQITYSTNYDSLPSSLVIGDINKDNHSDIVVANSGTDNIGIFLGYGNGTFANQQIFITLSKSNPSSIAMGDFNNDDKLDIIVADNGTNNIGIFFGYGNGSFQSQVIYSTSSKCFPEYITVGDLNKDNALDILVIDSEHDQVHIVPGYGNGSFGTITTYDGISGSYPLYAIISDFNNNNHSGITVVNYKTNNVLVLTDYVVKPSARQTNYYVNSSSSAVTVSYGDFNSDHILDIVYATYDYIWIRDGLGDGTFGTEIQYAIPVGNGPQYLTVEDMNNDTKMDIIIANRFSNDVSILFGFGNNSFAPLISYSTGINSGPWWVALDDVNNDYRVDIISANTGSNTIGVLLGNNNGTFDPVITYSTGIGSTPYSVAIGDLNNDNHLDLAVVHRNNYVVIFSGYSNGTFIISNALHTVTVTYSLTIALADFNNDNNLDIVVTNPFANNISVFLGYGNATFTMQTLYSSGPISRPYYVITADFNNDNITDIVTTNFGSNEVAIFIGKGDGSFELDRIYSTEYGSQPYGIVVADFDNDHTLEIVVALSGNKNIAVLNEYLKAIFTQQIKYLTGPAPQPLSVAVGDFNNDNQTDIIIANSGTDDLGILLSSSDDTFNTTEKYQIGIDSYPRYVITTDINKDDKLDVISVNSKIDSISVIIGHGDGTFAEQIEYSTGNNTNPVAVAVGDFDKNNRLDLIIANENANHIGIFFGYNYTIFQNQMNYSSNDSLTPSSIGINDFNNDTYLDIAATFSYSDKIGILLGDGNGGFTNVITYSTGISSYPNEIGIDDFNNDDRLDIVVTLYAANSIGVFLGDGDGNFANITTYSTGEYFHPLSIGIADFNHDNYEDIVVTYYGSNVIGILLGYGNGNFSIVKTYATGASSISYSVVVGDFNNDYNFDIAIANYDTRDIRIFFGYGNATFQNPMILLMTVSSLPMSLTVGDFNDDNRLDIAVADQSSNRVGIFIGYGDGSFTTMTTYTAGDGSTPRYISVGDFNNDNKSDIAIVNEGTNSFAVLFGLGDGRFLLGIPQSTGIEAIPYALGIGDFNRDNRLDIAVANFNTNNIGIFLASGSLPFGSMVIMYTEDGSQPHAIAIKDLNNDTNDDIIMVNSGSNELHIFFGNGNGTFQSMIEYSTGNDSAPSSVAIADFDNDTYLDMVVTNSQTDNIVIFLGIGNDTFVNRGNYSTGIRSYPSAISTGDFNNNNIIDIAVANYGTNNILLLYGRGDGTFDSQTSYPLGYEYRPVSIATAYLNQDDRLDIVIACYGTNHIETLIKLCL